MERGGRTERGTTEVRRGAVTRGRRRGSDLSGLGPGKRKKRARPKSPSASSNAPALPALGEGRRRRDRARGRRQWRGDEWKRKGKGRRGFKWATMSVWEPTCAVKGASWRSAVAAKAATGRREEDDAGWRKKGKRGREKGACPLASSGKGEGSGGDAAEGGGTLPPSLGGLRAEWRGRGDDDGDDGGAVWSEATTRAAGAGSGAVEG